MWRPWSKPAAKHRDSSSSSPSGPLPTFFSCTSFKDIHNITSDVSVPPPSSSNKASNVFHRVRVANSLARAFSTRPPTRHLLKSSQKPVPEAKPPPPASSPKPALTPVSESNVPDPKISIPSAEKRVVVYLTSLRVVRPTFDDCKTVQSILRGFRVEIDERDLSMDSSFLAELQNILGRRSRLTLPQVFIGGRYVGGAEEVTQLHEMGELKNLIQGLPVVERGVCDTCGGYRFVLCNECNGSRKVYSDKSGFKICSICNENGLIRCISCSSRLI